MSWFTAYEQAPEFTQHTGLGGETLADLLWAMEQGDRDANNS